MKVSVSAEHVFLLYFGGFKQIRQLVQPPQGSGGTQGLDGEQREWT